jgi:hypothetical protein
MKSTKLYVKQQHFLAIGLALLLMLLAACGTNTAGTTTGSGGSGSTATATKTSAAQNCGVIHTMRLMVVPADQNHAKSTEDCFWQAYQGCHTATFTYFQASVDTANIHTFSLQSQNGQCVITDALQQQTIPRPAKAIASYTCTGLAQQSDGLHFTSCGSEGNLVVPAGGAQ